MVCLLPVLSLQLHRYPKCIAKGRTPGGGVNATDGLSCSAVVFLLNELLFVTAHVDDILKINLSVYRGHHAKFRISISDVVNTQKR